MRRFDSLATRLIAASTAIGLFAAGCGDAEGPGSSASGPTGGSANAFLDGESAAAAGEVVDPGKSDTGYQTSLDAREVEVDIEGDVEADSFSIDRAPLEIGQFALTNLRKGQNVYLQSLAEDYAHGTDKIEWQVGTTWVSLKDAPSTDRSKLKHFRMRGVSAVVMHPGATTSLAGKVYQPIVPVKPGSLFSDASDSCGEPEGGIDVAEDVYWYLWSPEKSGCKARTQTVNVTVSKVLPKGKTSYPEYDRLIADGKLDILVLFGQVDHDSLKPSDLSFSLISDFEAALKTAGFAKAAHAPKGLRYSRTKGKLTTNIDIYGPKEFAGLEDFAHIDNFDEGVRSHEIIVYNGHSVLGASDFWARPSIYQGDEATKYQIFLYNGCLGYEYYVNPILDGKQGWDNVDMVSNIVETPFAIMVEESAQALGMIVSSAERGGTTSWQTILRKMNSIAKANAFDGESFYGASGVRDNVFKPAR